MIYIVAFFGVLGVLVFVHEFGHFIVAKLVGVKVLKFSLGFGPRLIGKQIGETEYVISAIPLGGYVKPLGESSRDEVGARERSRSFLHQSIPRRMAIVAAGPVANFLLAVFIFSLVFTIGVPQLMPVIGEVAVGFPAQAAGIKKGDRILRVNAVKINQWVDLPEVIAKSEGKKLQLTIKRGEALILVRVVPRPVVAKNIFGEEVKTYQIGITPSGEFVKKQEPAYKAVGMGVSQGWFFVKLTIVSIVKVIKGVVPAKQAFGGPVLIAQIAGKQAQEGLLNLVFFTAVLSVNLCVLNLFPIPILDGGHLLFLGVESIIRRPLSVKKMEVAQQIGLILILLLMALAFYNDIMRLIPPGAR
jgi:regulator of sigma E protease